MIFFLHTKFHLKLTLGIYLKVHTMKRPKIARFINELLNICQASFIDFTLPCKKHFSVSRNNSITLLYDEYYL